MLTAPSLTHPMPSSKPVTWREPTPHAHNLYGDIYTRLLFLRFPLFHRGLWLGFFFPFFFSFFCFVLFFGLCVKWNASSKKEDFILVWVLFFFNLLNYHTVQLTFSGVVQFCEFSFHVYICSVATQLAWRRVPSLPKSPSSFRLWSHPPSALPPCHPLTCSLSL